LRNIHRILLLQILIFALPICVYAAPDTWTPNDIQDQREGNYAFTNATITINPNKTVSNATLLIRAGKVEKIGANIAVPASYAEFDLSGRYIYPSFIDLDSDYGMPEPEERAPYSWSAAEVTENPEPGAYNANAAIKAEYQAAENFNADRDQSKSLREIGFGAVLTHRRDGLARGTGALVLLADRSAHEDILKTAAATHYAFEKGSSTQTYPRSAMGFVALLRQTNLDADWYAKLKNPDFIDHSLIAWHKNRDLPQIIDARQNWLAVLRADKLGDEFGTQYIIRSAGDEYQRIESIKQTKASLIVPINFPVAMDVSDPILSDQISLTAMKHWELAPTNPGRLANANINFAITANGSDDFWKNLRKAHKFGLSEAQALAALTTAPAKLLGVSKQLGSLQAGAQANFLITSDTLFSEQLVIEENWVAGQRLKLADHQPKLDGRYQLIVNELSYPLEIKSKDGKASAKIAWYEEETEQNKNTAVQFSYNPNNILLSFVANPGQPPIRLTGQVNNQNRQNWGGRGQLADGTWVSWRSNRIGALTQAGSQQTPPENTDVGNVTYPFTAFGRPTQAASQNILFRNATVWTNEQAGVLEQTDVLVKNGKIAAIGENLPAGGAQIYDASNRHLTSGIIDEHSHIALLSVNDIATNSGMVRMGDVIDSEDINIYRNLAGGVTAAQLLHGSANPIGGQSALVKFRWGATPEEMKIEGADKFIKFALGENVKRSSNQNSVRFPQTRMGVEQVYRDAFSRAQAYQNGGKNQRRDLAMDAMSEIVNGDRFITCHSYVQSEINMLMKVADDYDFRVNTFTHILEGYKVADKMAAHGAGGSTFSDWWAYKWEVRYAIPYNAALMDQAGVTVAINSDSQEMSRRLNQEAAKSVKYGGMDEAEAWKMVTLNPAKLLHLDDRMGSVKVGKDADLVVWTDHPLSIYTIADLTMIDGKVYYSRSDDLAAREMVKKERLRLTSKLHAANQGGEKTDFVVKADPEFHCDSLHGYEHLTGAHH